MQLIKDPASRLIAVLNQFFQKEQRLEFFLKDFQQKKRPIVSGLSGSALSFFIDSLTKDSRVTSPLVIILSDDEAVRELWSDLSFLWPSEKMKNLFTMSTSTPLIYRFETANPEILMALASLGILRMEKKEKSSPKQDKHDHDNFQVYLISATQLVYRLTPFELFEKQTIKLSLGKRYVFHELRSFLDKNGYMRVARVDCPGEYAQRGDILDIYCPHSNLPLRLYFFDEELEEIRFFSVDTQKSIKNQKLSYIYLCPFQGELGEEKNIKSLQEKLNEYDGDFFGGASDVQVLLSQLDEKLSLLSKQLAFPHDFSYYSHLLHGDKSQTLFDYFCALKASLLWIDPNLCLEKIDDLLQSHDSERDLMKNQAISQCKKGYEKKVEEVFQSIFLPAKDVFKDVFYGGDIFNNIGKNDLLNEAVIYYNQLPENLPEKLPEKLRKTEKQVQEKIYSFSMLPIDLHRENLAAAKQAFARRLEMKQQLWLLSHHGHSLERLGELFSDLEKKPSLAKTTEKSKENLGQFFIAEGRLSRGFQCEGFSLWLDHEIFGRRVKRSLSYAAKKEAWLDNFFDLKEDQYVVHINEGIGIYRGLQRLKTDEMEKDYLKIEYADRSYLFVPVEQLSMVQKYVGSEGEKKLDKLGGRSWDNLKKRVKKNVESLARELITLYSKRAANSNTPFGKDDVFQQEFELRFPFEETEDQLRVTDEIKSDLEKSSVMDRLLCADVGFGKTEVALRAIFKAVMNGFQCVFLVPTTILSMQHYRNFVERFKDFPISMVVLNRFVAASEQGEVFRKIASGAFDVIITTHKIFSEKISFKNLGLFVIDEEQKFGVKQKEHLKKRYPHVNTLSLSATPIPRTLHMSMSGIRDISFIHTPPHGRKQVEVRVLAYDNQIVKSVIQKEVKRGGQVFFVHNFVETIASIKEALQKILPDVSMEYVHGQMKEDKIRQIISGFLEKKIDVLVTTAIIENGIDIRNANTLLVHHAERFGLSQLYQLKGRVGRGEEKAYAYFFYPRGANLSKTAMKRLRFLNETTQLGSGFSLAMRDLEIRGAGNLLGPQQSGSIAAVGYELYCKLLQETVEEVRLSKPNEDDSDFLHLSTVVDLRYDGFVSDDFIDDNVEKVRLYRRIASLESQEQIEECTEEIVDRFGPYPAAIEKLLAIAKLRIAAAKVYILSIVERVEHVEITFNRLLLNSKKQSLVKLTENIFNSIEKKWVVPMPENPNQVKMSLAGLVKDLQSSSLTASEKRKKRDEFFWTKHKKLMNLVIFWSGEN